MDLDSVLLSVEERDKWRRRLRALERSLLDVQARRQRIRARLRRIRRDLTRLTELADAVVTGRTVPLGTGGIRASSDVRLPAR
jgi:hypothetical protein